MKCQSLFCEKNKKTTIVSLSSAESAPKEVKDKYFISETNSQQKYI